MSLVDLVIEVHRHLDGAGRTHAFGGALALSYIAEPRGTVDVDVNVFSPVDELDQILDVFGAIGLHTSGDAEHRVPSAGIRLRRKASPFPVDVFPSLDERYHTIERRLVLRPFGPGDELLPFLSAEDLALFKLSFGRDKDWVDLRAIAAAHPDLDVAYIEEQLLALRGAHMHPRLARLRSLLRKDSDPA